MNKNYSLKNPVVRFISSAFILYILWYIVYEAWLHPTETLDLLVIENVGDWSELIIEALGFTLIKEFPVKDTIRTIGIDGTTGVWIGDSCNGISVFALFAGFIIAYPGSSMIKKMIFIALGMLSIHIINIVRVSVLAIIQFYNYEWLDFNHTYTFTFIMYLYVFALWYYWILRINPKVRNEGA